ncbi:MAG TPA: hypothetical protein VFP35_03880 [Candidatus Saccharimonadales bacterium]|nr:hypothetical protein [Candidatus Saccharimonadales bacterium]
MGSEPGEGPLDSLTDRQLFALGAGAVAGLGLVTRLSLSLRRWQKRRSHQEKYLGKVGSLKLTVRVKTPRLKILSRS